MSLPPPQSLGHGIHLVPIPLPFPSPPWVNCYLIESDSSLTALDCGADWPEGQRVLVEGMDSFGLDPQAIDHLIVTHLHPDHVGMAPRLRREWGCEVVMHKRAAHLYQRYNDTAGFIARVESLGRRHGVSAEAFPAFADVGPRPTFMPLLDAPDRVVEDGDRIDLGGRELVVLHTPGHEPAHICLLDPKSGAIFSGDHVLPRISPVIMYDEEYEDVLADYLQSLRRLREMSIGLTYPAHGVPFDRGASRVEQLLVHHDRRLADMLDRVRLSPTTAWRVMEALFRPNLSPVDQRLALRETVAHLEHLRLQDLVEIEDRGGVAIYQRRETT